MSDPNPTPKSPEQVSKSPDYEVMSDYVGGHYWPSADEVVVKHKSSNTFWRAVYAVGEDDSEWVFSATWRQVTPVQVTTTKYELVGFQL